MKSATAVAIVGAGPYGLSLAAHLDRRGIPFRIFGSPMQVWREQMPQGMQLKSDGFASDLYDPDRRFTLRHYCQTHGIAYADYGLPVRLDTFVAYALEFQRTFVRSLEPVNVAEIRKPGAEFQLRLHSGETLAAERVVMATGISFFSRLPAELAALSPEHCSHSSAHHELSGLRGRRVAILGGGSSATDLAALLHQAGASVRLVSRRPLEFHLPPGDKPRSLWQRLRAPNLGLGPSLRSALYTAAPGLFHRLPRDLRLRIVKRHLGPSGGWFIKDQVIGKVQLDIGYHIQAVLPRASGVTLQLASQQLGNLEFEVDHVIAATGYRPSIERLNILHPELRSLVRVEADSPILSSAFESSVAGLHFIGLAAANSFGPVMRFALGAEYAAGRLSAHLAGVCTQRPVLNQPTTAHS